MDVETSDIAIAVFTFNLGILATRITDFMHISDTKFSLQRDNRRLEKENEELRQQITQLQEHAAQSVTENDHKENQDRNQDEISILRMLANKDGQSVKELANALNATPDFVLTHLVQLSYENFVNSTNYGEDPSWDYGCAPHDSTWFIQQPGRLYLVNNGLLT